MTESLLMAELLEEICQRLEAGEAVDVSDYVKKYPALAAQIQQLIPAIAVLGELSQSAIPLKNRKDEPKTTTPAEFGDYRIIQQIGHGGMGVVYEAEQMSLGRRVAVKILPFASLWSETAIQRFQQEVRLAAMLEHPHIVPIYAVGCERDIHFYAMKLIDGCSLADVISSLTPQSRTDSFNPQPQARMSSDDAHRSDFDSTDPSTDPRLRLRVKRGADTIVDAVITAAMSGDNRYRAAARLAKQAASALAFAHQKGVIHRDIKPSNLLLDRQGRLFIADFGLARSESDPNLTRTGDLLGTPRYMSPEQASGSAKIMDARTDIYSLGATLYELLTLQPVIRAPGRAAAIRELGNLQVASPRSLNPEIPRPLEQIVLKCLQADAIDRYATAGALVEDLDRYLSGHSVLARSPSLVRRSSRWLQRHPQTTLATIVALIAFSLISTFSFWMSQHGWLGSTGQRGPPVRELADLKSSPTIPSNFSSPQESPDMLRKSQTNNMKKTTGNRRLFIEQLESRTLFAQLAFGTPVNLGTGVNSFDHEEGATATADGLNLMFNRYGANGMWLGIFEAKRERNTEVFGSALSAGPNINFVDGPVGPSISADGLTLLFSDSVGGVLYQATRSQRNEPFSNVQNMGIHDLLPGQKCENPSLSSDGNTLYFSAYDSSHIQNDIYQATRASTSDPWGNVLKLESEINTTGYNDAQPSISSDGLMLFFNSYRPGGFGSSDLYVSTRLSVDSPWGNAVNLGPQVNTPYDEKGPFVSVDGSQLYYVSSRPGGVGGLDLYQVPILGTHGDTKFYVVDDGTTNRTFEYQAEGIALEAYALASGNTMPRGVASNAAGDRVWVVDDNGTSKKVYVYDTNGALLGNWTAASLSATAQVEGITTNGTDVWIVDNKADRVYRYAIAAGILSGTLTAADSFPLNNNNKNPKDIVTDGTSLWVVNDAGTDKVFKYRISDKILEGSWTITGGGGAPTGITLDPSGGQQHLWIVDNSTDRVYQYDNARSRTSGSQASSTIFPLAASNTNPQGIADPPPGAGLELASSGNVASETQQLNFAWVPPLPSLSDSIRDNLFGKLASTRDEPDDRAWIDELVESLQVDEDARTSPPQNDAHGRFIDESRVIEWGDNSNNDEALILLVELYSSDLLP